MPQERQRWVVATAEPATGEKFRAALVGAGKSVALAQTGPEALNLVQRDMPEVLVVEMVLPTWDAPALLEKVKALKLFTLPYAVVLSRPGFELFDGKVSQLGACRVVLWPADARMLAAEAEFFTPMDRLPRAGVTEQGVKRFLWTLGFSAQLGGTNYLAMAVEMASRDARLGQDLVHGLYPLVAERFATTEQRVEHAMRRAIESAWSGGSLDKQYRLFGNTIDARRAKPTSGEMIACVAEQFRTGLEMEA